MIRPVPPRSFAAAPQLDPVARDAEHQLVGPPQELVVGEGQPLVGDDAVGEHEQGEDEGAPDEGFAPGDGRSRRPAPADGEDEEDPGDQSKRRNHSARPPVPPLVNAITLYWDDSLKIDLEAACGSTTTPYAGDTSAERCRSRRALAATGLHFALTVTLPVYIQGVMTEVPDYLLERSRARRAALGLGGGGDAPAPAGDGGGDASPAGGGSGRPPRAGRRRLAPAGTVGPAHRGAAHLRRPGRAPQRYPGVDDARDHLPAPVGDRLHGGVRGVEHGRRAGDGRPDLPAGGLRQLPRGPGPGRRRSAAGGRPGVQDLPQPGRPREVRARGVVRRSRASPTATPPARAASTSPTPAACPPSPVS